MSTTFDPTRVPIGGTVRGAVTDRIFFVGTDPKIHAVPGLSLGLWVRHKGRHVDTSRTVDDDLSYDRLADWERDLLGYDWPRANHRKP